MRNKPHSRYVAILLSLLLLFALSSCDLSGLQRNMLITPQGSEEVNKVIEDTVSNITNPTEENKPSQSVEGIVESNENLSPAQKDSINKFMENVSGQLDGQEGSQLLDNIVSPIDPSIKETLASASDVDIKNMNSAFSKPLAESDLKTSVTDTVDLVQKALEQVSGDSGDGGSSSGFDFGAIFNKSYDKDKVTVADAVAMQIVSDVVFNQLLPIAADEENGLIDQDGNIKQDVDFTQILKDNGSGAINDAVSSLRLIDKLDTTIFAPNMISNLISNLTNNSGN